MAGKNSVFSVIHHEAVELANGFDAYRMIFGVAEDIESHDRILHRRVDGAKTLGMFHPFEHPVFALANRVATDACETVAFPELENAVGVDESSAPTEPGIAVFEGNGLCPK